MDPLIISIKTAIMSTAITFFLGIYSAYYMCTVKRGKQLLDAILTLPLVLPPTVIGYFLLVVFGKASVVGQFLNTIGIRFVFTWAGTVVASVCVAFPLFYRTAKGAFEQVDRNLIYAARTLGISERRIFYRVVLPNCIPGILAATVLAFTRTIGEFGATIMLAGNLPGKTQTISIAIYQAIQTGNRTLANQWVFMVLCISFISIVCMSYVSYRVKEKG